MEKVYLLFRNNQRSGPFTIGELLQQQLMPSDMIWIEGKSTAWTYLSELELNPHVNNSEAFDQLPVKAGDEIEKKAEELRQRILTSSSKTFFPKHVVEVETHASPNKLVEEDIQFIDHRTERKSKSNAVVGELLLTCFVIGLFVLGIYKGPSFLQARHKVQNSVAIQLNSADHHAARKNTTPTQAVFSVFDTVKKRNDSLLSMQKAKHKPLTSKKTIIDSVNTGVPLPSNIASVNQQNKKEDIIQPPLQVAPKENAIKKDDTPKKEILSTTPEIKTNNESGKVEKKGFLRGLFKKKKKENN